MTVCKNCKASQERRLSLQAMVELEFRRQERCRHENVVDVVRYFRHPERNTMVLLMEPMDFTLSKTQFPGDLAQRQATFIRIFIQVCLLLPLSLSHPAVLSSGSALRIRQLLPTLTRGNQSASCHVMLLTSNARPDFATDVPET